MLILLDLWGQQKVPLSQGCGPKSSQCLAALVGVNRALEESSQINSSILWDLKKTTRMVVTSFSNFSAFVHQTFTMTSLVFMKFALIRPLINWSPCPVYT